MTRRTVPRLLRAPSVPSALANRLGGGGGLWADHAATGRQSRSDTLIWQSSVDGRHEWGAHRPMPLVDGRVQLLAANGSVAHANG